MPSVADTIRRFQAAQATAMPGSNPAASGRLERLASLGTNPGALAGWFYAPATGGPMPLVVVLHGCTQTAAAYDHGAGWSDLAERFGFAVLFPEQQRANNANLCFNWFRREDITRNSGEASSIRQATDAVAERCPIDPGRVFVTGLSAGGAMANVMLATYPELFAGGSIIAGLPYGSAKSVSEALELMRGAGHATAQARAEQVRRASSHAGPWPKVSVWHGDADHTVSVVNADAIVDQWRILHGAADAPDRAEHVDRLSHRTWLGRDGRMAVEEYRIAGLGHGTPLKTSGSEACGHAGAHMIETGVSSTWRQAQSWGLLDRPPTAIEAPAAKAKPAPPARQRPATETLANDVNTTIERALRAAGLMR